MEQRKSIQKNRIKTNIKHNIVHESYTYTMSSFANNNKLENYFWKTSKQLEIHKWHHYLSIYDKHFKRFQGKNPTILEIGISKGGSVEMWNHYFDGQCTIYGIDIDPACLEVPKKLNITNAHIELGDQSKREFWQAYLKDKPKFDIVVEDGGHTMEQQIVTYEELINHVSDNGVYLCEDLHTSYWESYGGGFKKSTTFIEYAKQFVDMLNIFHIRDKGCDEVKYKQFRKTIQSVHFYDSVVVLEKQYDPEPPKATIQH